MKFDLEWNGQTYELPLRRQMDAIGAIEEHITRGALASTLANPDPPLHRIALAWAAVLSIARAPVTPAAAYAALCEKPETEEIMQRPVDHAVRAMLRIMLLPKQYEQLMSMLDGLFSGAVAPEKPEASGPLAEAPTSGLSRQPSKQRAGRKNSAVGA